MKRIPYTDLEVRAMLRGAIAECRGLGLNLTRDNLRHHGARGEACRQDVALEHLVAEGYVTPEEHEGIKARRARLAPKHRATAERSCPRDAAAEKEPARPRPGGIDLTRALYWQSVPRKRAWYVRARSEAQS